MTIVINATRTCTSSCSLLPFFLPGTVSEQVEANVLEVQDVGFSVSTECTVRICLPEPIVPVPVPRMHRVCQLEPHSLSRAADKCLQLFSLTMHYSIQCITTYINHLHCVLPGC